MRTAKEISEELNQSMGLINVNLRRLEKRGAIDFIYDVLTFNKFNQQRRVKRWYRKF